jgi:CRISPR system Cascade subunit CasE
VEDTGEKSDLKERVLVAWLISKSPEIAAKLKNKIESNERYREVLEQRLAEVKLLEWAMKAVADCALETWLSERGERNGFVIARDTKRNFLKFQAEGYRWHALPKKGRTAGFSSVDFEGEIGVSNPALFLDALFTGIGPAKAFGCGLMLVRRI